MVIILTGQEDPEDTQPVPMLSVTIHQSDTDMSGFEGIQEAIDAFALTIQLWINNCPGSEKRPEENT